MKQYKHNAPECFEMTLRGIIYGYLSFAAFLIFTVANGCTICYT